MLALEHDRISFVGGKKCSGICKSHYREQTVWDILSRERCVPFGLIQLSPDTDTIPHNVNGEYQKDVYKYCAGYQYSDNTIVGFSHTHLRRNRAFRFGDILIMPTVGELKLNPGSRCTGRRISLSFQSQYGAYSCRILRGDAG